MCIHLCIPVNTQDEHTNIYVNAQLKCVSAFHEDTNFKNIF